MMKEIYEDAVLLRKGKTVWYIRTWSIPLRLIGLLYVLLFRNEAGGMIVSIIQD
jgi:hypothetical protein